MKKMEIRDDDGSLAAARRRPTQARSRERVERMLAAAADLIARKGSEQVRMQEVATQAGVSLASLYQFFPDKSALIRTLAERYNAESRRCIVEALANVSDLDSLLAAYSSLVDQYFEIVMAEPAMRDIWSGMQADKQLAAVHLAECRTQGQFLADALCKAREVQAAMACPGLRGTIGYCHAVAGSRDVPPPHGYGWFG